MDFKPGTMTKWKSYRTEDGHEKADCPKCTASEHLHILDEYGKCEICYFEDKETKEIAYEGWQMIVHQDGTVKVTKAGETREYRISEPMSKIEQEKDYPQYVRIDVKDTKIGYYLFKFEDNDFLVGDTWSEDNVHLGEFAMHVFGEDCPDMD